MQPDLSDTLYPNWTPPRYPAWINRLGTSEKKVIAQKFHMVPGPVAQAQQDGLNQLVPLIVVTGKRPDRLRAELGKAVWRAIHHGTEATNVKRARLWVREMGKRSWSDIALIRPCHLSAVLGIRGHRHWDAVIYAGQHAERHHFHDMRMLFVDTERMGTQPKAGWSVSRLRREHDALALEKAMAAASPEPWAPPFSFETNGYRFERLISDLDLSHEGLGQRHCVASYQGNAKRGDVIVLRITGRERATLAFSNGHGFELKGFANTHVSKTCETAAKVAAAEFMSVWGDRPIQHVNRH